VVSNVAAGLDLSCGLGGACSCVAATETGHECGLCGAGLDHVVVASGMHIESLCWVCVWVECLVFGSGEGLGIGALWFAMKLCSVIGSNVVCDGYSG
jgi:hypothetical protein